MRSVIHENYSFPPRRRCVADLCCLFRGKMSDEETVLVTIQALYDLHQQGSFATLRNADDKYVLSAMDHLRDHAEMLCSLNAVREYIVPAWRGAQKQTCQRPRRHL